MQVTQLTTPDAELQSPETMRRGNNPRPRSDLALDFCRKQICHVQVLRVLSPRLHRGGFAQRAAEIQDRSIPDPRSLFKVMFVCGSEDI